MAEPCLIRTDSVAGTLLELSPLRRMIVASMIGYPNTGKRTWEAQRASGVLITYGVGRTLLL